jgi:hypothetical protein
VLVVDFLRGGQRRAGLGCIETAPRRYAGTLRLREVRPLVAAWLARSPDALSQGQDDPEDHAASWNGSADTSTQPRARSWAEEYLVLARGELRSAGDGDVGELPPPSLTWLLDMTSDRTQAWAALRELLLSTTERTTA